jgi:phosphoribosylformylglycinamidine cyclo-ligase
MDYQSAGVDVVAGRNFVQAIGSLVKSTHRPEVLGGLGGFSGWFELPQGYRQPVLVAGTDGVGTKLKIAQVLHRHDTIGIDLVAMCVNDILTCGAEPLFFLDYLATGKLDPGALVEVVAGITTGCQQAGCALLGGETAEMPGFYQGSEYDLAGFTVGVVEKSKILDGSLVQGGDVVIGLASSGLHSNGYSLVRKVITDTGANWSDRPASLGGASLGEVYLTPTRIYAAPILAAPAAGIGIHAMAHITGGGLPENLPRCLPAGRSIRIDRGSWPVPAAFSWLGERGAISERDMYHTFNMGIGFALVVSAAQAGVTISWFATQGIEAWSIGEVVPGDRELLGIPA